MTKINIRNILPADNVTIAKIIRDTLMEFGAARPGTVYYDADTDRLSEIFAIDNGTYFIAEVDGQIAGGAGIYPTAGLGAKTCELVKMYLLPSARALGLGRQLMQKCIDFAGSHGYKKIYLETMPELSLAIRLYEKTGFETLEAPLGHTGHFGCGIYMMKEI